MTHQTRARILTRTWTFWAGLAVVVFGSVQAGLILLQPQIPPLAYAITNCILGIALAVAKYISIQPLVPVTDTHSPEEHKAADHTGSDDVQ